MSKPLLVLSPADTAACCPPLSREPLSAEQAAQVAPLLKALADPFRLRLMSLIASHPGGEACVCDLNDAFDLSQPTISHHLKVLHEAGLLDRDKRGVWVYYRARTEALASLGDPAIRQTLDGLRPTNQDLASTVAYQPSTRYRYTLTRLHARGGIGQVWLARDEDLGRDVALKELLAKVERYARMGASLLRTDRDGTIRLSTDGRELWVETPAGSRQTIPLRSGTTSLPLAP